MLNVVVRDMAASLDFYRRLGIAVPAPDNSAGVHVQLKMPGGFSLELDTAESARLWHAGWRVDPASVRMVINFVLPTRQAVDDRYAELTEAGYRARQSPFDAFWGARYAIVADPDGNDVGARIPPDMAATAIPRALRTGAARGGTPPGGQQRGYQLRLGATPTPGSAACRPPQQVHNEAR